MTYHISLAQAPLGLSGQIDTEKTNMMKWRMKDTLKQKQVKIQTRMDNMRVDDSNHIQELYL